MKAEPTEYVSGEQSALPQSSMSGNFDLSYFHQEYVLIWPTGKHLQGQQTFFLLNVTVVTTLLPYLHFVGQKQ